MVVDKINAFLSAETVTLPDIVKTGALATVSKLSADVFKRQFIEKQDRGNTFGLSAAGSCPRKLAYARHNFEVDGRELNSRSRLVFWYGDLIELGLTNLAVLAGCDLRSTGEFQEVLKLSIAGVDVYGHPDGVLVHEGESILFECKSMTSFSFDDFEKGNISDEYLAQVNMYMYCLGFKKCVMLACAKDSGTLDEQIITFEPDRVKSILERLTSVIRSTPQSLPPRLHQPNSAGKLPWQCAYCGYYNHCWPGVERVLKGKNYQLFVKKGAENG